MPALPLSKGKGIRMFDTLDRITQLREKRGWTQYRLAKDSGIPQSTLATMFSKGSSPSVDTIEHICDAFDITLVEFFDNTSEYTNDTKLASHRKHCGLSRDDLARKTGIPVDTICSYEQRKKDLRKAPFSEVNKLAQVLGCKAEDIVDE